jgi:predicted kinase
MRTQLLLIGGRSGVGKSSAAIAFHELLKAREVQHAVIEGDLLDLAYPAPHEAFAEASLAERNLSAMWANFRALGYSRLVLTNTSSILFERELAAALGDDPVVTSVLLRATDATAGHRLSERARGASTEQESAHSSRTAVALDAAAPDTVHRLDTDGRTPPEIAAALSEIVGWTQ